MYGVAQGLLDFTDLRTGCPILEAVVAWCWQQQALTHQALSFAESAEGVYFLSH